MRQAQRGAAGRRNMNAGGRSRTASAKREADGGRAAFEALKRSDDRGRKNENGNGKEGNGAPAKITLGNDRCNSLVNPHGHMLGQEVTLQREHSAGNWCPYFLTYCCSCFPPTSPEYTFPSLSAITTSGEVSLMIVVSVPSFALAILIPASCPATAT
jgi:hypothetical protein